MKMHANPVGIVKKDIYIVKNDINNRVYIGQSLDADKRFKSHCKKNNNISLLGADIQKYGKKHFWYEIIEKGVEDYDERECYWISYYNSIAPNGYNILAGGNEQPHHFGDDHPNVKISDRKLEELKKDLKETKQSFSMLAKKYNISKRQVQRINSGVTREKLDESYPIRKENNINGKLTEWQVDEIIELLKYTYRLNGDIARQYGVEVHAISRINEGTYHRRNDISYPIRKWKSSGKILFTYQQVTDIINEIKTTNHSLNSIAKKYNVEFSAIKNICSGSSKKYRRDNLQYPLRPF